MPNTHRSLSFAVFVLVVCSTAAFGVPEFINSRTQLLKPIQEFLGVSPEGVSPIVAPFSVQTSFTPGNLAVCRIGDGSGALSGSAFPVFIDEYTTGGTLVQSVPIPATTTGSNIALTLSGNATNECQLSRSPDGRFIVVAGYAQLVGATSVSSSNGPRVIGRIDANGNVDTSSSTISFGTSSIRSATTVDGTGFWAVGSSAGVVFVPLAGFNNSTVVSNTVTINHTIHIFNGQLYTSDAAGASVRIGTVGTGTPTTTSNTITNLPGFPMTAGSPNSFYFADLDGTPGLDTLYVADDGAAGSLSTSGGVKKFSLVSGTWTFDGVFPASVSPAIPAAGFFGLAGKVSGQTVTLYATRGTTSNQLVQFVDSTGFHVAPTAVPTLIATSATNTVIRSVVLAPITPQPGIFAFSSATYSVGEGGGTATITVTRSGGSDGTVGVSYSASANTATGGSSCTGGADFLSQSSSLSFANGETSKTFSVPICDDALFEGDESINLALSDPTGGATLGSPNTSVLTVQDDDTAFAVDSTAPVDGATNVPNNTNVVVVFNRAANTSTITTNTADTACSGSLQLSSDNFATCVRMAGSPVVGGSNAVFTISPAVPLSGGTAYKIRVTAGAQDTLGDSLTLTVTQTAGFTIAATPTVQFSSATYKGAEGTTITVTVGRSSVSGTTMVDYATSGGTAAGAAGSCTIGGGADYQTTSGTLTFNDGDSSKTFDVTLCKDLLEENPAETVGLVLSNPSGATLGAESSATLSILDVANEFSNSGQIDLIGGQPAAQYPSTIDVSGVTGSVNGVRLSLTNVTAPDAHNIEILLVDPTGTRTFRAMAAVGGNSPLSGATITLEDAAPVEMAQDSAIVDGQNYKPANCTDNSFKLPDPAPALPYGDPGCSSVVDTFASVFGGVNPNGTWKLFVFEHQGADRPARPEGFVSDGSIGGWGIQFLSPTAARVTVAGRVVTAGGRGIRNAKVTISGGDLAEPMTMYTADFGYYYFTGVTAGQTYFVTVEPRRYTISHPTRVVNLLDSMADLDFVADP